MSPKMLAILGKVGGVLSLLIMAVSLYFAFAKYHQSIGYDKAVTEISKESAALVATATIEAIRDAEIAIQDAQKRNRVIFDAELAAAKEEQTVKILIKEVINEVDKIVYVDNCGKLNADSIRLLNKAINHANRTSEN